MSAGGESHVSRAGFPLMLPVRFALFLAVFVSALVGVAGPASAHPPRLFLGDARRSYFDAEAVHLGLHAPAQAIDGELTLAATPRAANGATTSPKAPEP